MTPSLWRDLSSGETLSIDEIAARYGGFFPGDSGAEREFPEWDSLRKSVSIRFIQTQRLLVPSRERLRYEYPRDDVTKPTVMEYARQLAIRIERELAKYAYQSQDLDRSFPRRLIEQQQGSSGLKDYQLREKLGKLEEKRQQFIDAGLLDKTEEMSAIPEEIRDGTIKDDTRGVLSIYVDDVAQKLGVLDPIASKIDLLRRIINRLFHEKQMKVSKDKGFTFTTSQGNRLSPQDLSSGEQHELVMLYEFLFKVQPNTLVMIDEPEISLHVVWQGKFLSDLQEIIKLSNFDVLMATHSPDIISDKWELTVGLGKTTA
jgi:predicted ATP-dependent endonuclease of OLD family